MDFAFNKVKQIVKSNFRYLIKLVFVLVTDLYLKKFIQFTESSFASTTVDDELVLCATDLKLNADRLNRTIIKKGYKITDSSIGQVRVPFTGINVCDSIFIDQVNIDLEPINENDIVPDENGQSLVLSRSDQFNQSTSVKNTTGGVFDEVVDIIRDLILNFQVNITNLRVNVIGGYTCVIEIVSARYSVIKLENIDITANDDRLVWLRTVKIRPAEKTISISEMEVDSPNVISRFKNKLSSKSADQSVSLPPVKIIIKKLSTEYFDTNWEVIGLRHTLGTKEVEVASVIGGDLVAAHETKIIWYQVDQSVFESRSGQTGPRSGQTRPRSDPENNLFTRVETIYCGRFVKPKGISSQENVVNYIRRKVWPVIVQIKVNRLTADVDAVQKIIQNNTGPGGQNGQNGPGDFRLQISINNADLQNIWKGIGLTSINTCVYIDPVYKIIIGKHLFTDSVDECLNVDGFCGVMSNVDKNFAFIADKIQGDINNISDLVPKKKNQGMTQSVIFDRTEWAEQTVESLVKSMSDLAGGSTSSESKLPAFMVRCQKVIAIINGHDLCLSETEYFGHTQEYVLLAKELSLKNIIRVSPINWTWSRSSSRAKHNITLGKIDIKLSPSDLSDLVPDSVREKVKSTLSVPLEEYLVRGKLQKYLSQRVDRSAEFKRMGLAQIIPGYSLHNTKSRLHEAGSVNCKVNVSEISVQFTRGTKSSIDVEITKLKSIIGKNGKVQIIIPDLRVRDNVDGSVWTTILSTRGTIVTFVGGTLDINTPNTIYANLDHKAIKFIDSYTKATKIGKSKSTLKRIFTSRLNIILSVKSKISLKNTKITISPLRVEGPGLVDKIVMRVLADNDQISILLQGIKPLRPLVRIVRDGVRVLNIKDPNRSAIDRLNRFFLTSATELLELGAEIGISVPESDRKKISCFANQPLTVKDGLLHARTEFFEGVQAITKLIHGKSKTGALGVPLVFLRPFTNSMSKVMLGILNEIDPDRREIVLNKY